MVNNFELGQGSMEQSDNGCRGEISPQTCIPRKWAWLRSQNEIWCGLKLVGSRLLGYGKNITIDSGSCTGNWSFNSISRVLHSS